MDPEHATLKRLDEQLRWYERKSRSQRLLYQWLKVAQIAIAAAIPVAAALKAPGGVAAVLGGTVVVLEGIQQLYQFQQKWISYRSTAEALKRERHLHEVLAGPYAESEHGDRMLAERLEALISDETAGWVANQKPNEPAKN